MGQQVAFLGGISSGELGSRLVDALRAEGVSLDAVHRSAAPTTISLIGVALILIFLAALAAFVQRCVSPEPVTLQ